jgi:hypothetical protein
LRQTAPGRQGANDRFLRIARQLHPNGSAKDIAMSARSLRAAWFADIQRKAVASRRQKAGHAR